MARWADTAQTTIVIDNPDGTQTFIEDTPRNRARYGIKAIEAFIAPPMGEGETKHHEAREAIVDALADMVINNENKNLNALAAEVRQKLGELKTQPTRE